MSYPFDQEIYECYNFICEEAMELADPRRLNPAWSPKEITDILQAKYPEKWKKALQYPEHDEELYEELELEITNEGYYHSTLLDWLLETVWDDIAYIRKKAKKEMEL